MKHSIAIHVKVTFHAQPAHEPNSFPAPGRLPMVATLAVVAASNPK
jgi:hypothetical protein